MLGVILASLLAQAAPSPSPAAPVSPAPVVTASPVPSPSGSPLPFIPPAGWAQLPSGATRTQSKNVWAGPKGAGGVRSAFSQAVMPIPMPVTLTKNSKRITLCGVPSQISTVTGGTNSTRMTTETEMSTRGGYTYITVYVRPASQKADPRIQALLTGFCPPRSGELAVLKPPAGWTVQPTFQLNGVWMGPAPMQMMMLATGPRMKSLADVAKSAPNPMKQQSVNVGKSKITIKTRQATLCGLPAMFLTMRSSGMQMPLGFDGVVTQGPKGSYVLMYMHPSAQAPLSGATAALQTLCANPAAAPAPAPSSTP